MWGYLKYARKDGKEMTNIDYWYEHQDEWQTPDDAKLEADKFVDQLYVKASEDFKNKDVEQKVRQLVIDWEQGDKKNHALWSKILEFSYQGQKETYARLGTKFDKVWHEHEHYQKGKDLVEEGLKKGVFKKLEDGAVLSNLEEYKLSDTIIIKSDGTSLYITQDLALTQLKKELFHTDKLFWVVGPDQTLALRQLFAICEQLGIAKREDLVHISFGYMSIKGKGKMSSRAGNVVYIEDLLDDVKTAITQMFAERKVDSADTDTVAEKMAVGAVKYSILKVGRTTDTAFDFETSLSLDGDSGPYLQYTYARCRSVLAQAENNELKDNTYSPNEEEVGLLCLFPRFSETIEASAYQYAPNLLCNYLFDLAQAYNLFYQKHQILKADEETKKFRLALTQSVAQILKNGLAILGIETVDKI
jgi:arginyl-tRNA synthetase